MNGHLTDQENNNTASFKGHSNTDKGSYKSSGTFLGRPIDNDSMKRFSTRLKKLSYALSAISAPFSPGSEYKNVLEKLSLSLLGHATKISVNHELPVFDLDKLSHDLEFVSNIVESLYFTKNISKYNSELVKSWVVSLQNVTDDYMFSTSVDGVTEILNNHDVYPEVADPRSMEEDAASVSPIVIHESRKKVLKMTPPKQVSDRRPRILDIVRSRGSVQIKDIASVVTNCSEKTLQRELSAMVSEGILSRSGDRRWTVYSLKSA